MVEIAKVIQQLKQSFSGVKEGAEEIQNFSVLKICLVIGFLIILITVINSSNEKRSLERLAEATCKLKMPELCGADPYCKADPEKWCKALAQFCSENFDWNDTRCNLVGLR